jgi:hypothetical protein
MAKLPKRGWLQRCEECEQITSRIIVIEHCKKSYSKHSCISCRENFIKWLFIKFDYVIIMHESVSELVLYV